MFPLPRHTHPLRKPGDPLLSAYPLFDRISELREQLGKHWVQNLPNETLKRLAIEASDLAKDFVETSFIHPYFTERDQLVEILATVGFLLVPDTTRSLENHIVSLLNLFEEETRFSWTLSSSGDFLLSPSW